MELSADRTIGSLRLPAGPILRGRLADVPDRQPELSSGYRVIHLPHGPLPGPGNLAA